MLQQLTEELGLDNGLSSKNPWEMVIAEVPRLEHLPASGYPYANVKLGPAPSYEPTAQPCSCPDAPHDPLDLEVLLTELTFGTEELSSHSPTLAELTPEPFIVASERDAAAMGLKDGDLVRMRLPHGSARCRLCVSVRTAPGTIVLPRLSGSGWQGAGGLDIRLAPEAIALEEAAQGRDRS
jgi:anaerobic selenocysteine-containing dehydrogenase